MAVRKRPEPNLSSKKTRDSLPCQPEPHFRKLDKGERLGLRKRRPNQPGVWVGEYKNKAVLGTTGRKQATFGNDRDVTWRQAQDAFYTWVETLRGGTREKTVTVVCDEYLASIKTDGGQKADKAHERAERLFRRLMPLCDFTDKQITEVTAGDVMRIKTAMREAHRTGNNNALRRDFIQFRAMLNHAVTAGYVDGKAWKRVPNFKAVEAGERHYIPVEDRKRLLDAMDPAARAVCQALLYTGCRPGEEGILGAKRKQFVVVEGVGQFHSVYFKRDGQPRKYHCELTPEALKFFEQQSRFKLPESPLFFAPDGQRWRYNAQFTRLFNAALKRAGLPQVWCPYDLRHTVISDWIQRAGVSIFTVAQWTGTSVAMIEKHYGHLRPKTESQKLHGIEMF